MVEKKRTHLAASGVRVILGIDRRSLLESPVRSDRERIDVHSIRYEEPMRGIGESSRIDTGARPEGRTRNAGQGSVGIGAVAVKFGSIVAESANHVHVCVGRSSGLRSCVMSGWLLSGQHDGAKSDDQTSDQLESVFHIRFSSG